MKIIEGNFDGKGRRFALVASRFNSLVVEHLVRGAEDCLLRHGVQADDIVLVHVPGAAEIPQALHKLGASGKFHGLIALGCVIRGATPHFDQVVGTVTKGVADCANDLNLPVTFGVLTTDNLEQALERSGTKGGNKGFDSAMAALEMVSLWEKLI